MDDDDVTEKLEAIASKFDRDVEEVRERYTEEVEKVKEKAEADIGGPDRIRQLAVAATQSGIVQQERTGAGGPVEEVPILALGHGGTRTFGKGTADERQVVIAHGIVNPPDDPAGLAVFVCDESEGVDLGNVRNRFHAFETLRGWFRVVESEHFNDREQTYYVCNSTGETRIEEVDPDEEPDGSPFAKLPSDIGGKRQMVHDNFVTERATLDAIHESFSRTNDEGYTVDFGLDLKRFEGSVLDYYRDTEGDWGTYVLTDETVIDPEDLRETDIVGEDQRTPGLKVFIPPEHVKYGDNSRIEVYGTVSRNQDGQVLMNGVGAVPVAANEIDHEPGARAETDDDGVEEETI